VLRFICYTQVHSLIVVELKQRFTEMLGVYDEKGRQHVTSVRYERELQYMIWRII